MSNCPFCAALESDSIVYEDEKLVIVVPEKVVCKGHFQVIPKEHKTSFQDYSDTDVEHFFYAASFAATALFENLQAHGTNIIANTGGELNNKTHFHIDVIARWGDDKLNFLWTPQQQSEDALKSMQSKIKDKADLIGVAKKKKEIVDLDKGPEKLGGGTDRDEETSEGEVSDASEANSTEKQEEKSSDDSESPAKEVQEETSEPSSEENYLVKQLKRIP